MTNVQTAAVPPRPTASRGRVAVGDNLTVLRRIPDERVDLVYLDPPFNTGAVRTGRGRGGPMAYAFPDVWHWSPETEAALQVFLSDADPRVRSVFQLLQSLAPGSSRLAHLAMLAPRLQELHRVLKPTGSLFLHCDAAASAYVGLLLDAVFGPENFRNQVIWAYKSGGASRRRFACKHDVIWFYARNARRCKFRPLAEKSYNRNLKPYRFQGVPEFADETGWFTWVNMRDVWMIDMIGRTSRERVGYPAQKPEALLERIVLAATDPGDLVLDPFCGSGTTLAVAKRLGRRYLGIDANPAAVRLARRRLQRLHPDSQLKDATPEKCPTPSPKKS